VEPITNFPSPGTTAGRLTVVRARWVAWLGVALAASAGRASGQGLYFYHGLPYGSQSSFSPPAAILHSGFYNFQIDNRGDDPFELDYGDALRNVMENLADPVGAIGEYGWGRFLTTEILPNPSRESAQWVPNYLGHVLGEGLAYRTTYEWYRIRGVRNARVLAILNVTLGALLNEVVENGRYDGPNVDPIADFYIFNPIGIALFNSDAVSRFLATRLGMAYWQSQAAFDPGSRTLQGTGYRTVFRLHPGGGRLGVFATYGTLGLLGVSYRINREERLAVAVGIAARDLVEVDSAASGSRTLTATTGPGAGIFVDRNGSLLASLTLAPDKQERVAFNLYPGVLGRGQLKPGLTLSWHRLDGVRASVHFGAWPVGLAGHTGRGTGGIK
jgi:hypothetical protein